MCVSLTPRLATSHCVCEWTLLNQTILCLHDYTPPSLTSTFLLQCCLSFPSCAPLPLPPCTRMRLTGYRVGDVATRVFAVDGGSGLLSHDSGCVYNDHAWVNCAQCVGHNTPVVCPRAPPSVDVFCVVCCHVCVCVSFSRLFWPRLTVYANGPY